MPTGAVLPQLSLAPYMDGLLQELQNIDTQTKDSFVADLSYNFTKEQSIAPHRHEPSEPVTFVNLMFYEPSADDYVINKIVARQTAQPYYTGDGRRKFTNYAHVELCFQFDVTGNRFENNGCMGFSITQHSMLYMKHKMWRSEYQCFPLYMPQSKYQALYRLCTQLAEENIGFDRVGMYGGQFLPISMMRCRCRRVYGTFCSKIIVEVLQECEVGGEKIKDLEPCLASPNSLVTLFDECVVGSVASESRY